MYCSGDHWLFADHGGGWCSVAGVSAAGKIAAGIGAAAFIYITVENSAKGDAKKCFTAMFHGHYFRRFLVNIYA